MTDSLRNIQTQLRDPLVAQKYLWVGKEGQLEEEKWGKCRDKGHVQVSAWDSVAGGGKKEAAGEHSGPHWVCNAEKKRSRDGGC